MKTLSCKDLDPTSTCDYEATASTAEEVVDMMAEHAKSAHADKIAESGNDEAGMKAYFASKVKSETNEEEMASEAKPEPESEQA